MAISIEDCSCLIDKLEKVEAKLKRELLERNRAHEALRDSEAKQSLILQSLPVALYTGVASTDHGTVEGTWTSNQVDRISGFPPERFVQEPTLWQRRLHPDDRERVLKEFLTPAQKERKPCEYRWRSADGTYRWFLDQSVLLGDKGDEVYEILGVALDITRPQAR